MSSLAYRALTRVETGGAREFNTLLFAKLWKAWGFDDEAPRPMRIFDLGRVQSSSIAFFTDYPCYLTLADAIDPLAAIEVDEDSDEAELRRQVAALIPVQAQPYDLILVWDCLNYLSPRLFPLVQDRLRQLCHRHSHVHGFLYTASRRFEHPRPCYILAADRMACQPDPVTEVQATPMSSLILMKHMPAFSMEKSVLMRNGMQEFILGADKS